MDSDSIMAAATVGIFLSALATCVFQRGLVKLQKELVEMRKPNLFIQGTVVIDINNPASGNYELYLIVTNNSSRVIAPCEFRLEKTLFNRPILLTSKYAHVSKSLSSNDKKQTSKVPMFLSLKEGDSIQFKIPLSDDQHKKLKDSKKIEVVDNAHRVYKGEMLNYNK